METILAAVITGGVTLIGVLIANGKTQAVTETKLEELTREVRMHNNFAQRVPVIEEQLKVANHRIADLEEHEYERERNGPMMNKKIPAATIARTVVLALALANQLLSAAGKPVLPIDSASVEQWVTAGLTTAAAIWAWWENNSFTPEAIHADELLDQMQGKIK